MTTTFEDGQLYYHSSESRNRPIVLLHGFLESSRIWEDFSTKFASQRQVIYLDFPGHGQSDSLSGETSLEAFAEAIKHVLDELQVEKVDLLGHSMGGYAALAFVEKYPERVDKLILLNSTSAADTEEKKENRERSIELVKRNKKAFVSMAISNLLAPVNADRFREQTEALIADALQFPVEGITGALEAMKNRTDRTRVLKHFRGKKFMLTGEQDPLLEYQEIEDIAEETRSKLYAFPGGHLSYLENKNQFLKIVQFIE